MNTAHLHNEKPTPFRFILNYITRSLNNFTIQVWYKNLFLLFYSYWFEKEKRDSWTLVIKNKLLNLQEVLTRVI